jgi:hypothetical protein
MKLPLLGNAPKATTDFSLSVSLFLVTAGLPSAHAEPAALPVVPAVQQWSPVAGTLACPGFTLAAGDFADVAALLAEDARLLGRAAAGARGALREGRGGCAARGRAGR